MRIIGETILTNIRNIRINRIVLWELGTGCEGGLIWRKTEGGEGFQQNHSPHTCKNPEEMQAHVNEILDRRVKPLMQKKKRKILPEHIAMLIQCPYPERAYKWWKSGDTLNITRKDLPKPKVKKDQPDVKPA